jgi:hypothetical protein
LSGDGITIPHLQQAGTLATIMKRLLAISFFFSFCVVSCGQRNCITANYLSTNWSAIDSTKSFFICSNSSKAITNKSFIDIEYLGTLKPDENIVLQKDAEKKLFSLFTNLVFGRFSAVDKTLPSEINYVLKKMTENSTAIMKYDFASIKPFKAERKLAIYFKDNIDSAEAAIWVNKIRSEPFIDSTRYISKEEASKILSEDISDWQSVISENPIPSSVNLFIKESSYDSSFIVTLKNRLLRDNAISDVIYSDLISKEMLQELNLMLTKKYLVKLVTKE